MSYEAPPFFTFSSCCESQKPEDFHLEKHPLDTLIRFRPASSEGSSSVRSEKEFLFLRLVLFLLIG